MLSKEICVKIWNAYQQVENGKKLIEEMEEVLRNNKDLKEPCFRNAFGERVGLELGVPSGRDSSRIFGLSNVLGKKIIKEHVRNSKKRLKELMKEAEFELCSSAAMRGKQKKKVVNAGHMEEISQEVQQERVAQLKKWGVQNHPCVDQVLVKREGGFTPERMCEHYEIPSESRAKFLCENSVSNNQVTWTHIALEEFSEAVSAKTASERRKELVQLAAVVESWIDCIDRHEKARDNS